MIHGSAQATNFINEVSQVAAAKAGYNHPVIAALFDSDGTLTEAQFGRGLLKYAAENGRHRWVRMYYASLVVPYFLNKLGFYPDEALLRKIVGRLAWLLRGMDEAQAETVFEWSAHQYLLPSRRTEVITRLDEHREQGHKVIIVSAQYLPNLKKIGQALGAAGWVGTRIEVKNGRITGNVLPPVVTGKDKQRQTLNYVQERQWDIDWDNSFAYADSFTDMDLFDMVGHPVAVHPDEKLLEHARREGWGIIGGIEQRS